MDAAWGPLVSAISVPRLWPDSTVVLLATGPSLTQADVDYCRDKAHVIAINDAYKLAPWAEILYGCDRRWWLAHPDTTAFAGEKYGLQPVKGRGDIRILRNTGPTGLELDPTGLKTGRNSGYQAIGLAVHLGAKQIVLLGYDMRRGKDGKTHFFGEHKWPGAPPFQTFLTSFSTLEHPLKDRGIDVVNCTPGSALNAFRHATLRDTIRAEVAA